MKLNQLYRIWRELEREVYKSPSSELFGRTNCSSGSRLSCGVHGGIFILKPSAGYCGMRRGRLIASQLKEWDNHAEDRS